MARHAMARGDRLSKAPSLAMAAAMAVVFAPEAALTFPSDGRDGFALQPGRSAGAAPAGIRLAQDSQGGGGSEAEGGDPSSAGRFTAAPAPLTGAGTAAITTLVSEAVARCETLAVEYRIACLAGELRRAAAAVPPGLDYQEAKTVLHRTARRLDAVARTNRDPAKPRVRPPSSRSAYPAVRPETLAQATAQAVQVIEEAETRLLRSAESSERRRVHYQSIARSVGSTTRILRS